MTAVSKNVYFDVLDDIVDKYDNIYHRNIKLQPIDIKSNSYAEYNVDSNDENPKFQVGAHVRISKKKKKKKFFAKVYTLNCSEEAFVIKKVKNNVPWAYVISVLNGEEEIGTFYEKELQKTNLKEFKIEKVIKIKGNKQCVKWKDMIIHSIVALIKRILYTMIQ